MFVIKLSSESSASLITARRRASTQQTIDCLRWQHRALQSIVSFKNEQEKSLVKTIETDATIDTAAVYVKAMSHFAELQSINAMWSLDECY